MPHRHQRTTLIARDAGRPDVDWNPARTLHSRIVFLDPVAPLKFSVGAAMADLALDVERIIADRVATADDFLELLCCMPREFAGDALLIRVDGSGFLSATGRGGNRVLYALSARDIRFYLETNDLVCGRAALELTA